MANSNKFLKAGDSLQKAGASMQNAGNNLTRRLTIPIILVILGIATFPIGIIFWIIALYMLTATKK